MDTLNNNNKQFFSYNILIILCMIVTSTIVILAAKWVDDIEIKGKKFNHPFFQTACMFVGELICLFVFFIAYWIKKRLWARRNANITISEDKTDTNEPTIAKFNPFIFILPSMCDVINSSLGYVGLNLTTASSYQMLRGAVIVFTGLLSMFFLRMRLEGYRWLGMIFVVISLVIIGITDIFFDDDKAGKHDMIIGNIIIVVSEFFVAIQIVIEQKFLCRYDVPPMLAVGLEGLFGLIIMSFLMVPMYFIHVPDTFSTNPSHRLEDALNAFKEMRENPTVIAALMLTIVSLAFFNFSDLHNKTLGSTANALQWIVSIAFLGLTISKRLSSTTRIVIDSLRTLFIWIFSIWLFKEQFIAFQLIGFALLVLGMFVYNDVFFGPYFRSKFIPKMGKKCICCIKFCGMEKPDNCSNNLDINQHE